jgi:hypothetical protein
VTTTRFSDSLKEWRGLKGTCQSALGGSRGSSSREKGIGGRGASKTGGMAMTSGTGIDNRQRGVMGASCRVQLGKKWRKEEKGFDGGRSTPFEAHATATAVGGSGLGVPRGGRGKGGPIGDQTWLWWRWAWLGDVGGGSRGGEGADQWGSEAQCGAI